MNYKKIYESIINNALDRKIPNEQYDRHHIIPRSLGGVDYESNMVNLTLREHFICHLLLAKIYGGPMIRAAFLMSSFKKYNSSRQYKKLREEYISNFMNGDMNPTRRFPWTDDEKKIIGEKAKGRKWVNNGIDSCMAKGEILEDLLSKGWILGRLLTPSLIEGLKNGGKATGGHNKGIPMSDEQYEKMKPYFQQKGKPSPRKGIPMSDEQREKCKGNFFKKGHVPYNKKEVDK